MAVYFLSCTRVCVCRVFYIAQVPHSSFRIVGRLNQQDPNSNRATQGPTGSGANQQSSNGNNDTHKKVIIAVVVTATTTFFLAALFFCF